MSKKYSLEDLLSEDAIELPLQRMKDEDYLNCLNRVIFDNYLNKLERLASFSVEGKEYIDTLREGAKDLSEAIIETVRIYHSGNLSLAYEKFKTALNNIDDRIRNETGGDSVLFVKLETPNLYRIRYEQSVLTERKELFHIPMKYRENVPTQRFSIAGNPSLYLGSSLFICWKESGLPDIWNCYASRYEIFDSRYVFLDIRNWLPRFRRELPTRAEDQLTLFNYLCLWPLVAACSVKVKYTDRPFKPEYIISQLLYQYTSELKSTSSAEATRPNVLGLLYSSTRSERWESFDPDTEYNIAIPVLQTDSEVFSSELKDILPLTLPLAWKTVLLDAVQDEEDATSAVHYFGQIGCSFSRMESLLKKEQVAKVDQ